MSESQTAEAFDTELKDELFDFETAADGETVSAEVTNVSKRTNFSDEKITVKFRLPTGKTVSETMPYPMGNTSDWKFVRLAQSCGYSLGSAEHIIGDSIPCRYTDDDGWTIVAPLPRRQRWRSTIELSLGSLVTPLWLPWGAYRAMRNDEYMCDDAFDWIMHSGIALLVWATAIFMALLFAGVVEAILSSIGL